MSDEVQMRTVPQSDLEYQMLVTDTLWGAPWVSEDLKEHLTKTHLLRDAEGKPILTPDGNYAIKKQALWGLMSHYTRDIRLSNLSSARNEINYVRHWLDYASDMIREDMPLAFLAALSRVVTVLETSQGRGGFLRKRMGTVTTEDITAPGEPGKKSLYKGKGDY